jgi:putative toxin-antitoxin system antitoxin component (TIGR02293 family)
MLSIVQGTGRDCGLGSCNVGENYTLECVICYNEVMTAAARMADSHDVNAVALDLLRHRVVRRRGKADAALMRQWIEKRLAAGGRVMSGIEMHREIEAGIPGSAIPTLLIVLGLTREDFSDLLGRARKTLNELVQREHLSRADSDFLYRIARALVYAVSVFGDVGYAVQWLKEFNEALGGASPLSLLATVEGDEVVHAEIGAVEHGLPV